MKLFAAALSYRDIHTEFGLPEKFPPDVTEEAARAQDLYPDGRKECTEVPFVTIDPPGSMDLDQAVHIESLAGVGGGDAAGGGWRVRYAIADVAAFVTPGGALERESLRRGQTVYLPDGSVRLHPPELSEGSASLLPDQVRPAVVWDMNVRPDGEVDSFDVYRATVRSVARFDYAGVERDRLAGQLHPAIEDLPAVGRARMSSDKRRNAINLRLPSISVEPEESIPHTAARTYRLSIDPREPMNDYNAEVSLMAGMCAAAMMVRAGRGLVRTLPPASPKQLAGFDTAAAALGFHRAQESVGELLNRVDASSPQGMALMRDAQGLLRGASYYAFGVGDSSQRGSKSAASGDAADVPIHAGVGGHYAHVTAPLRRLVDRYAMEICLAIASGKPEPDWVVRGYQQVVETMGFSTSLANKVDRACLDLTEAVALQPWVGHNFAAAVLHAAKETADVFISEPPVTAPCSGRPAEGSQTDVTLVSADAKQRSVRFAWPAD
ncbi:RNB domain-containing ribonuclease [Corynebacterium heidelbergense]|uniref:Exoribonuclease n=1 Tax=Corynebacterium heidelbergense TaxID=2055947 RepID=A0A364VBL5_9CORY|nr:RNB domain-containing ribonuclease [Corynebacterium heidelbergense]RAV33956.1 exoribonuclease [Corynebacterium heidelbergense]WCZ36311.1 Ribonuclease R [Corynebacterium heidelbergense]